MYESLKVIRKIIDKGELKIVPFSICECDHPEAMATGDQPSWLCRCGRAIPFIWEWPQIDAALETQDELGWYRKEMVRIKEGVMKAVRDASEAVSKIEIPSHPGQDPHQIPKIDLVIKDLAIAIERVYDNGTDASTYARSVGLAAITGPARDGHSDPKPQDSTPGAPGPCGAS